MCSIPSPTATQIDPFHAAPYPVERALCVDSLHDTPSEEYAIPFTSLPFTLLLNATATTFVGGGDMLLKATPYPISKISFPDDDPSHVLSSVEYAMVFIPSPPTATNLVPFHATPRPAFIKIFFPAPVHVLPSVECAIVFAPSPTATHIDPFHAIPYPLPLEKTLVI